MSKVKLIASTEILKYFSTMSKKEKYNITTFDNYLLVDKTININDLNKLFKVFPNDEIIAYIPNSINKDVIAYIKNNYGILEEIELYIDSNKPINHLFNSETQKSDYIKNYMINANVGLLENVFLKGMSKL